jgi:hypothetical protein
MPRATARSSSPSKRLVALALALSVLAGACGSGGSDEAEPASTGSEPTTSTEAPGEETSSTSGAVEETTNTAAESTTTALPDASEAQRTAPGDGTGTALLTSVRVGSNEGFERIVFEFEGTSVPGYRIQWVDGPITADGSGEPVEVAGEAYLEMVMQPASGVDLSAADLRITYEGPDRIATTDTELLTDLVRTGDFEAVLSWAAGATRRAPFRVLTLSSPTRVVVDLAT